MSVAPDNLRGHTHLSLPANAIKAVTSAEDFNTQTDTYCARIYCMHCMYEDTSHILKAGDVLITATESIFNPITSGRIVCNGNGCNLHSLPGLMGEGAK